MFRYIPKDQQLTNDMLVWNYMKGAETAKEEVKRIFEELMDAHYQLAATICGFTHPGQFNDPTKIIRGIHMAHSIGNDASQDNIERLCWTLYYSSNIVYKKVYGMEMDEHCEKVIMKKMGVSYRVGEMKVAKGCVSKYVNLMLNKYRNNVKDGIKKNKKSSIFNVSSNHPRFWREAKPRPSETGCLYWIKNRPFISDSSSGRIEGTSAWSWVSKLW